MSGTIRKVAVLYDDRPRGDTTGGYCLRALGALCSAHHFRPDQVSELRPDEFDLFLRVDDGLDWEVPPQLRPLAWWAIDTHVSWTRCRSIAAVADRTFAAQRAGADALRRDGILNAEWLPLACDPSIHRPHGLDKQFDFAFVGHLDGGVRERLLERLRQRYPDHFVGRAYFDEMARIYSSSRIVFNRSVADDLNMRVFEALSCGSLLATNGLPEQAGQDLFFSDGIHLATYGGADELFDKIDFFLKRPDLRTRVEAHGRAVAHDHHTYRHRMAALLDVMSRQPVSVGTHRLSPVETQDPGYFDHPRPELLERIPATARRVLDLGCGRGRLGASLKARQASHVTGWELDPSAAAVARTRLDRVVEGDIEISDQDFPEEGFDAIVCGDVLEHLRQPDAVLKRLHRWLTTEGLLIASIPNVMHQSVLRGLLSGDWTYEPAGLLDRTHLRFFTKREIAKLLDRAGFERESLVAIPGPGHENWVQAGRPPQVDLGGLQISTSTRQSAEEFFAYQWIAVARKVPTADDGLTSIIILTHNQLDFTMGCVASLRHFTDEPYELVFVDNGSSDGTPHYLTELAAADPTIRVVLNDENRGFPAGVNQGLRIATGRQILLLNNDTLLTTGWLKRLLAALHSKPGIGMVGPCSNRISGPQQIEVDYAADLVGLDGFAWERGQRFQGQSQPIDRLVGFCLLLRREVWETVGDFDERFGIGNFEDDDYCRRAVAAGYELRVALDAFVHHFGSVSFRGAQVDLGKLLSDNQIEYRRKWEGSPEDAKPDLEIAPAGIADGPPLGLSIRTSQDGGWELVEGIQPLLSVCLIVRDNESTIGPCLESIRPWVDEIVVVDTGSRDRTAAIAESLGAKVRHFPWCDDFSAARNESFRHARGRWLFWMDSDDTIPAENGRKLRELAAGQHPPDVHGYVVQVHCPGPGPTGHLDTTVVDHVKLVRNLPQLRFEGRIHEQILPAIRRIGGNVEWTELFVVHSGYDHTPAGQERKRIRDLKLLRLDLDERPGHPFALFNLGMTHADLRNYPEGAEYLRQSIRAADPGESHVRKAYALLIYCLMQQNSLEEALTECETAIGHFPDDLELNFRKALLFQQAGRHSEAIALYERILNREGERYFTSVDRGIGGYKARQNLAVILAETGEGEKALEQWRKITEDVPEYRMGWRGLGEQLLQTGTDSSVEILIDELMRHADRRLRAEAQLLLGRFRNKLGDRDGAMQAWEEASRTDVEDAEPYREMARTAFAANDWTRAEQWLRNASHRDAVDPRIWHNLGATLLALHRPFEAIEALNESLALRPNSSETRTLLEHALGSGRQ